MRHPTPLTPAIDVVFTEAEHGYAAVLDDARTNGGSLFFVAYAIVFGDSMLKLLQTGIPNVGAIEFITNIPSFDRRDWSGYTGDAARKEIDAYLSALHQDNIDASVTVSIVMRNHAKLAVSDRVAYVGSANFSDASAKKKEAGVVIRDPALAQELRTRYRTLFAADIYPYNPAAQWLVGSSVLLDEGAELLKGLANSVEEHRDEAGALHLTEADLGQIQTWARVATTAFDMIYEAADRHALEAARIECPEALEPAALRELMESLDGEAVREFFDFSTTKYVENRVQELTANDPDALDAASEIANNDAAERLRELFDDAWEAVESVIAKVDEVADAASELSTAVGAQIRGVAHLRVGA